MIVQHGWSFSKVPKPIFEDFKAKLEDLLVLFGGPGLALQSFYGVRVYRKLGRDIRAAR